MTPSAGQPVTECANPNRYQGVKDPFVFAHGGVLHMFLSVALSTRDTSAASHETLDIYNTGDCVSATALATRLQNEPSAPWHFEGVVLDAAAAAPPPPAAAPSS